MPRAKAEQRALPCKYAWRNPAPGSVHTGDRELKTFLRVWDEIKNRVLKVTDFSLNLKQILLCTASLLQCFIIQFQQHWKTQYTGKLQTHQKQNSTSPRKIWECACPPLCRELFLCKSRENRSRRKSWSGLKSGPSKPEKSELCPCMPLWGGMGRLCVLTALEECA